MSAMPYKFEANGLASHCPSVKDDFPNLRTVYDDVVTRMIVVPSDPTPAQRMAIIEVSGTLDFWADPEEDIYSSDDGTPV